MGGGEFEFKFSVWEGGACLAVMTCKALSILWWNAGVIYGLQSTFRQSSCWGRYWLLGKKSDGGGGYFLSFVIS